MTLAVVGIPSRESWPPGSGEDTLSQELRTAGLLRPHVLVGYQWSHTGFCPGDQTSQNRYIRSFVSQPPPVGSRTGARTVGSGGSSAAFALGLRVYPESYAALFLAYLNGTGFRVSSGASRLIMPPMTLILIQASLDSVRRS